VSWGARIAKDCVGDETAETLVNPWRERLTMTGEDLKTLAKRRVGEQAASLVESGMVVGLGTGSTAAFAIEAIGRRIRTEGLRVTGVPTSFSAAELARRAGVPLVSLDEVARIDVALDGADEVDPRLNLIKGRGAAHLREKIVESFADRFIVLVDESKIVQRLGQNSPVPIEVVPFGWRLVERELVRLRGEVRVRIGSGKDGPVMSDQGNLIADVRFGPIEDAAALNAALAGIPGLVGHGLFVDIADQVWVGADDGKVRIVQRDGE